MPQDENTFVIDSSKQAITVEDGKLLVGADFLCSNATHTEHVRELSVAMFLPAELSFTLEDFLFTPKLTNLDVNQLFELENFIGAQNVDASFGTKLYQHYVDHINQ
jgi:hypothetical protein